MSSSPCTEHLAEEERDIPPLLRANFTEQEEKRVVQRILQNAGLAEMRNIFPAVKESMESWATPEYIEMFSGEIPAPLRYVASNYYEPDYETFIRPKRDAPFLDSEPRLSQKGCFGISFCFRCVL